MRIKQLMFEDFVNYKKPSMFIGTISCGGKCWVEQGLPCTTCQNNSLKNATTEVVSNDTLIKWYLNNRITKAIVFGGLEPFEQFDEMYDFIDRLRHYYCCQDTVVIYTGYNPDEISGQLIQLKRLGNIIVKFGRYVPGQEKHWDEILGVELASPNQFAVELDKFEI